MMVETKSVIFCVRCKMKTQHNILANKRITVVVCEACKKTSVNTSEAKAMAAGA